MTVTMTMEEYMNLQQNHTNNWGYEYEYEFAKLKKENKELKEANKKLQVELFDCRQKYDRTFNSKEFDF